MDTPGIDAILTDIFLFKYLSVILLKKLIPGFKKTNRINMERYEEEMREVNGGKKPPAKAEARII
jgi:hypothetical protein